MIDKDLFPVWNEKYSHMAVTPRELYLRQNGLCWLIKEVSSVGEVLIYCTDGKDKAKTSSMLNPTFECVKCITGFLEKEISNAKEGSK